MNLPRRSGVVLHPTSLPGPFGIGDLGPAAFAFVDFLAASGVGVWQVMPLGPTGYGDSPYQCFSAFAGNPMLISPEILAEEGFLPPEDLREVPEFSADRVDYEAVLGWKSAALTRAFEGFEEGASPWQRRRFERFVTAPAQAGWLEDYALFRALKDEQGGAEWTAWPAPLARREAGALADARDRLAHQIRQRQFYQWVFAEQWQALRRHAAQSAVAVLGDVPIFVAHDSADAWSDPGAFRFDEAGRPTVVAGVPPDYFSPTGQLWGNPLYRWDEMAAGGFRWWLARMRGAFGLFDMVRLDHFRGFQAFWEVPAGAATAEGGRWVEAPGAELFAAIRTALGDVPIIAEDLGLITPEVEALRARFGFPGMKILQFAFGADATNEYLPHNLPRDCVVYTGTHDNDTTLGWYEKAPEEEKARARRYLGRDGGDICWDLIRAALASVADLAIVPAQDLLGIGSEGRMNVPGRAAGNWAWRMRGDDLTVDLIGKLRDLNDLYGRAP